MNTDNLTAETQQKAQHLLSCFSGTSGFRQREQQQGMLNELVANLVDGGKLMLEAPTGTGKTLAYLCGAVALADSLGKKIVIATGTINLQQQLMEKDIPWFMDITDTRLLYVISKGRSRYVCVSKLIGLLDDSSQQDFIDDNVVPLKLAKQSRIPAQMLQRLEDDSWNGDLDEWQDAIPGKMSSSLTSTSESCTGKQCDEYQTCPFQAMRNAVMRADVIVANQDLLLSDLDLDGGRILPPPDECLYIVDEAHGLPRKAVVHAAKKCDLDDIVKTLGFAKKLLQILPNILPRKRNQFADEALADALQTALSGNQELQQTLQRSRFVQKLIQKGEADMDARMHLGEPITDFIAARGQTILPALNSLLISFSRYADWLKEEYEAGKLKKQVRDNFLLQTAATIEKLKGAYDYWQLFFCDDPENGPALARWITVSSQDQGASLTLHTSPSWAVEYLQQKFWAKAWGVAMVSATLRALGSFDHFRTLSGLPETVSGVSFPSVFDYSKHARLIIPWMERIPTGTQENGYFNEVAEMLPALLHPGEGSLVLFTSMKAMRQVYDRLPSEFRGKVLMQGLQLSRSALLEAHRRRIDKGQGSIIFGLASFAEGVDLPGDLCRHVVITRIPFPPFGHPIARNIRDWMGNRHFPKMSLPSASMRLIQACGRLLRNEDDSGQISILDRRMSLRSYGKTLLQHLPAYQVQVENSAMGLMPEMPVAKQGTGTLIY